MKALRSKTCEYLWATKKCLRVSVNVSDAMSRYRMTRMVEIIKTVQAKLQGAWNDGTGFYSRLNSTSRDLHMSSPRCIMASSIRHGCNAAHIITLHGRRFFPCPNIDVVANLL